MSDSFVPTMSASAAGSSASAASTAPGRSTGQAGGAPVETLTVALLAGGRSSEREVSLASGAAIREGLVAAGHEVISIEIDHAGAWRAEGRPVQLRPGEGLAGADVVFPALHGPFGEDGTVQGALETLDVAYVGAGVAASAVCIDKVLFKRLLSAAAPPVPQVRFVGVRESDWRYARAGVLAQVEELGLPVFVKPAHLGSSVGIVRVSEPHTLGDALKQALEYDELAIVEAAAPGIEVECGVLGLTREEWDGQERDALAAGREAPTFVSEPGEIVVDGDWYDYAAKYAPGGMDLVVPARISAAAHARVRELASRTFTHVGCEGLARVDFFVDGDSVLVNELNTMPGFTPTSVYPKLMAASGVPFPELLDRLCRLAIERHRAGRSLRH